MDLSARIDRIEALLEGHTDRRDEASILELLAGATNEELDATLLRLDLARLIDDVDDRCLGPDNRARLLDLLTRERVAALSVDARAALIRGLARGHTPAQQERAIAALLQATTGRELSALKRAIDRGGDHRNLIHVVYSDVDDDELREAILAHVRREAAPLADGALLVLSDIDDTFYANWSDSRFAKKTVYPGVRQVYRELSREDPVFVTARPGDRPGITEALTLATLRARGIEQPTVLAGGLLHVHSHAAIAARKLSNFQAYAELFGEYDFVFIGDSGQGDASFGAAMREEEPDRVRAVLIHDVVDTDAETRARWASRGVRFFDSYVGAARILCELGLLDEAAWRRVADAAQDELRAVSFDSPVQRAIQERALEAELERLASGSR